MHRTCANKKRAPFYGRPSGVEHYRVGVSYEVTPLGVLELSMRTRVPPPHKFPADPQTAPRCFRDPPRPAYGPDRPLTHPVVEGRSGSCSTVQRSCGQCRTVCTREKDPGTGFIARPPFPSSLRCMPVIIRFSMQIAIKNSHDIDTSIAVPKHKILCYNF